MTQEDENFDPATAEVTEESMEMVALLLATNAVKEDPRSKESRNQDRLVTILTSYLVTTSHGRRLLEPVRRGIATPEQRAEVNQLLNELIAIQIADGL